MSVARHSLGAIHLVTEMQIGSAQPGSACQMENYNGAVKTNKNKALDFLDPGDRKNGGN